MKVRIFVSLISFMFILSACNNNQENVRSNKENTIDNTESFVNVITNDGATINPVKKSDSEMTESEKKEEPRYYESEDLVVALPLSPAYVNKIADELTDSDLIDILQNKLLPSDRIIQNMVCNGDSRRLST